MPRNSPPQRPPWWPAGEPWPPTGQTRRVNRRRTLIILGIALAVVLAGIAVIAIWGYHLSGNAWQERREDRPPYWIIGPIIFWSLVITGIVFFIRRIGRNVSPLFDLIDASDRVSNGDYSVRVAQKGPPQFRNVMTAFNSMTEKLEINDQQRRLFLSDIAHELRTPLAVIQGNVEGMIDEVYPRDDEHLSLLLRETELISRLLDDLQTLAKAESGTLELFREDVDLQVWLGDLVAVFRPSAEAAGVHLEATCNDDLPELFIDPIRMRQVLENLLANALRYTTEGGTIRLAVTSDPGTVTIRVIDNGAGIDPELAGHIFDRFVKSADSGGSGLGLAIARQIVETHGGSINATSSPGSGTTITLTIPRGHSSIQ